MNFVFISPQFPPNFYNFCLQLKNAGANVLGITDGSFEEFRPELKDVLTECYEVPSLLDYDALVRAMGYFTYKYGKIHRIDSQNEAWLEVEACLREDFNIYGQKLKDLEFNRTKLGMKNKFAEGNVPMANAMFVEDTKEFKDFIKKEGFPFVVKPNVGVGAQHTFKVNNQKELELRLKDAPKGMIIEKFVEGKIVTFDGLVNIHGEVIFFTSMEVNESIMDIVNSCGPVHYTYHKDIPEKLEKYGKALVEAFNIKERFFHFEFFKQDNGEFIALEVNVRPPGGYSLDMMNFMCDVDLYKDWAELVVNDEQYKSYNRKHNVAYVARRYRFDYKHSHEAVLGHLGDSLVMNTEMPKVFAGAMGDYAYIVRDENLERLNKKIAFIEEGA